MFREPAHRLRALFARGDFSAKEIVSLFLERIEKWDPLVDAHGIGAFLHLFRDQALAHAEALDAKRARKEPLGRLAGVPVAIKDNILVEGELATCASRFLSTYRAPFHATAVRRLLEEDAIILGKTNLSEFAMGSSMETSAYQLTRNPWNLSCTPGGSSGGSAAAVAARFCPIALGSDTGGSVRQPAALTGITGFKPSYGRVSRYGLVAFASSLDQIGPFTHNVADAALTMEIIGGHCPHDAMSAALPAEPYTSLLEAPLKEGGAGGAIGVPWGFLEGLAPEMRRHFEAALDCFRQAGMSIVDVDLDILNYAIATYYILSSAEASTNLARFDGIRYGKRADQAKTLDELLDRSRGEGFGPEVKNRILLGTFVLSAGYQDAYYKKAQKVRALMAQAFERAFQKCAVIAMPTSPLPAFPLGSIQDPLQLYLADIYTTSANLAGIPAISVPCGFSEEKKPLGLQLLAPRFEDARALRFGHWFEKQTSFHEALPHLEEPL